MDQYQQFIFKRTYAKWKDEEGRREHWSETVDRYRSFFRERVPNVGQLPQEFERAMEAVENLEVMPSMRALWSAGKALARENVAGYNCAYTVVESPRDFAEILYILMNGTGVGFSVERQYINRLPKIPDVLNEAPKEQQIVVEDSKEGWAVAYLQFLEALYDGQILHVDYSLIRPKGAPLKTFGGRASGPEPFEQLIEFTKRTFQAAKGRRLNSLEVYDIVTTIASVVIVGGVRRSATISLSNLSDPRMRHAKDGQFWIEHPNRTLSNNSVAYTEKPDMRAFMDEWMNLMQSGSGERGIVNRMGLKESAARVGRDDSYDFGVNPCGEIILRPRQFCNLTEVVVRPSDTFGTLVEKVKYATLLGVLQSTLTQFNFLSDEWRKNVEEERLLGVSLTGLKDHPVLSKVGPGAAMMLQELKEVAHVTARLWADALGIQTPKAVTTVKPSGTVSQLVDAASGMHPRYSDYYIRRVRVAATDPLAGFLMDAGVPWSPEVGQTIEDMSTVVFEFPVKAPQEGVRRGEESALEQLEYWQMLKTHWTDHNPSNTIYVKPEEWLEVGAWVYRNFDRVGGLSFLPYDGGVYQLAPYEAVSEERYLNLKNRMPDLDWDKLSEFEVNDNTSGSREWACAGDKCELV